MTRSWLTGLNKRVRLSLIALILALVAPVAGCGGEAGDANPTPQVVQRIFPSARMYTADDLKAAGLKVMHVYDITGLPHAQSAIHGSYERLEYEARFYASHEDAVAHGQDLADEVSGPDAIVTGPDVKWEEGSSHRRLCSRAAQTPHSGCTYSARYGDYEIRGNMVLLCEGQTPELALKACAELLKGVP